MTGPVARGAGRACLRKVLATCSTCDFRGQRASGRITVDGVLVRVVGVLSVVSRGLLARSNQS
jgi:hypothetical protein